MGWKNFHSEHRKYMSSYHLPEYWDERYKNDTEPFEWY